MTPEADLRLLVRTVASVFPQVSVWRGPLRYSWVINGSVGPHGPDLALLARRFAEPRVRGDLAEIGVPDPFAFLAHFVLAGGEVAAFAGGGPVASDDSTRLDFTVPRSLDSFFGFANASSGGWLVDLMEPGARRRPGRGRRGRHVRSRRQSRAAGPGAARRRPGSGNAASEGAPRLDIRWSSAATGSRWATRSRGGRSRETTGSPSG